MSWPGAEEGKAPGYILPVVPPPAPIVATSANQDLLKAVVDALNASAGFTLGADIATSVGHLASILAIDFSTSAKQDLAKGVLDTVAALLGTINTSASNASSQLTALAGALVLTAHEAKRATITSGSDQDLTMSATMAHGRITNHSIGTRVLYKTSAISSGTDATAGLLSAATSSTVPSSVSLPFAFSTIHFWAVDGNADITLEGYR